MRMHLLAIIGGIFAISMAQAQEFELTRVIGMNGEIQFDSQSPLIEIQGRMLIESHDRIYREVRICLAGENCLEAGRWGTIDFVASDLSRVHIIWDDEPSVVSVRWVVSLDPLILANHAGNTASIYFWAPI